MATVAMALIAVMAATGATAMSATDRTVADDDALSFFPP